MLHRTGIAKMRGTRLGLQKPGNVFVADIQPAKRGACLGAAFSLHAFHRPIQEPVEPLELRQQRREVRATRSVAVHCLVRNSHRHNLQPTPKRTFIFSKYGAMKKGISSKLSM